jgi:surfeit locus 1 family protein
VNPQQHEYLRVRLQGHYLNDRETLVQAFTELGAGFWVMTPFEAVDGFTVLINRGFVPLTQRGAAARSQGQIEGAAIVTGLVRMSEPNGRPLRANDRSTDQWYSRDVAAISAARGVPHSAPYFIDADAMQPEIAGAPVGGLTVIAFPNDHLQYALTWFALALVLAGGSFLVFRQEWRLRRLETTL